MTSALTSVRVAKVLSVILLIAVDPEAAKVRDPAPPTAILLILLLVFEVTASVLALIFSEELASPVKLAFVVVVIRLTAIPMPPPTFVP